MAGYAEPIAGTDRVGIAPATMSCTVGGIANFYDIRDWTVLDGTGAYGVKADYIEPDSTREALFEKKLSKFSLRPLVNDEEFVNIFKEKQKALYGYLEIAKGTTARICEASEPRIVEESVDTLRNE